LAAERQRLPVSVSDFHEYGKATAVAVHRHFPVFAVRVDVAETEICRCLPTAVADFLKDGKASLVANDGLLVPSRPSVDVPTTPPRDRLSAAVAELPEDRQALVKAVDCLLPAALIPVHVPEIEECRSLPSAIAELPEDRQAFVIARDGGPPAVLIPVHATEIAQGERLTQTVADSSDGSKRQLMRVLPIVPVRMDVEEGGQRARELPGQLTQLEVACLLHGCNQVVALRREPTEWLVSYQLADFEACRPPPSGPALAYISGPTRLESVIGLLGQREKCAQHPFERCFALRLRLLYLNPILGEDAEEIMKAVAVLSNDVQPGHLEQLGIHQRTDERLGIDEIAVEEGGNNPGSEVGYVEQAEQPEGSLLGRLQAPVAQGEARPHLEVAGIQLAQAVALVSQKLDQPAQTPLLPAGQLGAGDPHSERQVTAQPGDPLRLLALRDHPGLPGDLAEQVYGLIRLQDVEPDVARSFHAGQAPSTGDEHRAARDSREQRTNLRGIGGVVENDEDPQAVEP